MLSTVDIVTGAVIDTFDIPGFNVGAGTTYGDGTVVPVISSLEDAGTIVIVGADGSMREIPVGRVNFLGFPR